MLIERGHEKWESINPEKLEILDCPKCGHKTLGYFSGSHLCFGCGCHFEVRQTLELVEQLW